MPDLWSGRLPEGPDPAARAFTGTVQWDWRLAEVDILGSLAHVNMLGQVGLLTPEEVLALRGGLAALLDDVQAGAAPWDPEAEDVHTAVEQELTRRIGDVGQKLHTGRSRNDQVALDLHLYVHDACRQVIRALDQLLSTVADVAEAHASLPMPGYTHMQRAQPVTVGHHLLAYAFMWLRDRDRFHSVGLSAAVSPLGAGALAGSTLPLAPAVTAENLGFDQCYANSLDAVSDRDFIGEFLFAASLLLMHLSRFGEEVVLWNTSEFGFVEISDGWATGSSMMPQKKNPDVAELLRSRAARGVAQLTGLMTLLKGLPLAYNRDLQEDKGYLFQAHEAVAGALPAAAGLLNALTFHPDRLRASLSLDLLATDLADKLVQGGMPFRQAHAKVAASRAWGDSPAADAGQIQESLAGRDHPMGPGPESIRRQLATLREALGVQL